MTDIWRVLSGRALGSLNVSGIVNRYWNDLVPPDRMTLGLRLKSTTAILDCAELSLLSDSSSEGVTHIFENLLRTVYDPLMSSMSYGGCARAGIILLLSGVNDLAFIGWIKRIMSSYRDVKDVLVELYRTWVEIVVQDLHLIRGFRIDCQSLSKRCPFQSPCPKSCIRELQGFIDDTLVLKIHDIHNEVFDHSIMLMLVGALNDCIPEDSTIILDLSKITRIGEPVRVLVENLKSSDLNISLIPPEKAACEILSTPPHQ